MIRELRNVHPQPSSPTKPRPTKSLPLLVLVPLLTLTACGNGQTMPADSTPAAARPAAIPQIVYTGPGVPGTVSSQQLYVANINASYIGEPPQDNLNKFLPHFSPDGQHIVYTKFLSGKYGDPSPLTDIFIYTFATAAETRLTSLGHAHQAAWSPDGLHIAFGNYFGTGLYITNPDGSGQHQIGQPTGQPDDLVWHDPLWSVDNWIYFVVEQNSNNCLKVRLDRIRPDGTSRTRVSNGGPNCTPPNVEPYGDADPGISADGTTIYSSRGIGPLPADHTQTLRHLYAFSSGAYYYTKPEYDLSIAMKPDCTVGVPKGSPDGKQILTFLFCPDDQQHVGVTLTDTSGSFWTYIVKGFGPDWNPTTNP